MYYCTATQWRVSHTREREREREREQIEIPDFWYLWKLMVEAYQKFLIAPYVFHRVFGSNVSCFDQFVLTVLLFSFTKGGYEYLKHCTHAATMHTSPHCTACHEALHTIQLTHRDVIQTLTHTKWLLGSSLLLPHLCMVPHRDNELTQPRKRHFGSL